jgi:hypothetical protein
MKYLFGFLLVTGSTMLIGGCEEETQDYIADIMNTYMVESIQFMGETFDFSELPIEDAKLLKITRDKAISYENVDHCSDTYMLNSDEIESVTETIIRFTDGSEFEYSMVDEKLRLIDEGDIIMLVAYEGAFPPAVWTDPTLLTNDTYEPDNEFSTATTIAAGGTVQNHYMGECGDEDTFMFSATSGIHYVLETSTPLNPSLDLTLALYSGNGTLLDSDDDSGTDYNPSLYWTCQLSGDYYFVIEGFWSDDTGDYSVSVVESSLLPKPSVTPEKKKERTDETFWFRTLLFD